MAIKIYRDILTWNYSRIFKHRLSMLTAYTSAWNTADVCFKIRESSVLSSWQIFLNRHFRLFLILIKIPLTEHFFTTSLFFWRENGVRLNCKTQIWFWVVCFVCWKLIAQVVQDNSKGDQKWTYKILVDRIAIYYFVLVIKCSQVVVKRLQSYQKFNCMTSSLLN